MVITAGVLLVPLSRYLVPPRSWISFRRRSDSRTSRHHVTKSFIVRCQQNSGYSYLGKTGGTELNMRV